MEDKELKELKSANKVLMVVLVVIVIVTIAVVSTVIMKNNRVKEESKSVVAQEYNLHSDNQYVKI